MTFLSVCLCGILVSLKVAYNGSQLFSVLCFPFKLSIFFDIRGPFFDVVYPHSPQSTLCSFVISKSFYYVENKFRCGPPRPLAIWPKDDDLRERSACGFSFTQSNISLLVTLR